MKSIEDQYIETQIRENLLADLSAGTGTTLGDIVRQIKPVPIAAGPAESGPEAVMPDIEIEREVRSALRRDPIVP
jgi:hypothetical protein